MCEHAAAAAAGDHRAGGRLGGQERRAQVEVEHPVPLGLRVVLGRVERAAGPAADGVDDRVDSAEGLERRVDGGVRVLLARDVGGDRDPVAAGGLERRVGAVAIAADHDDPGPDPGERLAQARPDAARAAGDHGDAAVEPEPRELVTHRCRLHRIRTSRPMAAATGTTRLSTASRLASPRSSTSGVGRPSASASSSPCGAVAAAGSSGRAAAAAESPAGPGGGSAAGLSGPTTRAPGAAGGAARRLGGARLLGRRGGAAGLLGRGPLAAHLRRQAVGEPAHQLRAHVLHHAAAELGGGAGDAHVGLHPHARAALDLLHRRRDRRRRRALPAAVPRLRLHHRSARRRVGLLDLDRALVLRVDRADLDLHRAECTRRPPSPRSSRPAGTARRARRRAAPPTRARPAPAP